MKWHIEERLVKELKSYEHNPRTLTKKGLADLKKSVDKFGLAEPIVINTNGVIIGGHGRAKVLPPDEKVQVYVPDRELTEQEYKELNVRLNKNIAGEWDFDVLANQFELPDLLEWGFDEKDLKFDLPVEEDETPEVDEVNEPTAKLGDIYQLGEHRLMCGDSTKREDVELLMIGKEADLIHTDPPYGVSYEGGMKEWDQIKGDSKTGEALEIMLTEAFINMSAHAKAGGSWYVWHADREIAAFKKALEKADKAVSAVIVWVKNNMGGGFGDYRYKHEPCLYVKGQWYGGRDQHTVWEVSKDTDYKHPTQKPVELVSRAVRNSSKQGDIVLDLFGGSGSTLIACEQLGRKCYMMELDPRYCDVIIKRWEQFTGQKAVKL